ncbi:hypothetical protein GCM10009000_062090 [Halobacterium noricense]|uniref:phosphoserine phosphatase n=1 Tax=Haladaptatus pallidirubidus TaxID=1008152 RepID=A0AAV3UJD5_9EURY
MEDEFHDATDVPLRYHRDFEQSFPPATGVELVVFDFDGTLAEQRGSWGLLYRLFGVEERGAMRTEAFWDDELTFQEWCFGNVIDWRNQGATREHIERAGDAIKLTTGADRLLRTLSKQEIPYGILSSGITDLIRQIGDFDPVFVRSNDIEYKESAPVNVDAAVGPFDKGDVLTQICESRDITLDAVMYVGDSHSDLEAFDVAGIAVLFDPDDRIDADDYALVDVVIEKRDLSLVCELFDVDP